MLKVNSNTRKALNVEAGGDGLVVKPPNVLYLKDKDKIKAT